MRKACSIVAAFSLAAGCSKNSAPQGPDCAITVASVLAMSRASLTSSRHASPEQKEKLDAGQTAQVPTALKLCTNDKWSDAVRTCYVGATTRVALGPCVAMMTEAQQRHADVPAVAAAAIATLTEVRDEACKCTDAACLDKAVEPMRGLRPPLLGIKPSEPLTKVTAEMTACLRRAPAGADKAAGDQPTGSAAPAADDPLDDLPAVAPK